MAYTKDLSWQVIETDFPEHGSFVQKAGFLLRYAILAPSGHNTQPWLFQVAGTHIYVIADRRRALPAVDPYDRELVISCGAAIANLEIAALRFGFRPNVIVSPDPSRSDLLARVEMAPSREIHAARDPLFDAITARRTTRASFASDAPPDVLVTACRAHAQAFGIDLTVISDAAKRRAVSSYVDQGDHVQFHNPAFRRELASWVHSTRMGSRDGMSGTGFGMPDILAPAARFVMRTFDIGDGVAAGNVKKIVEGTPALALLSSQRDDQDTWVQTGRALERILLALTAQGFTASYLNQPIETPTLRPKLKAEMGGTGCPQILLRIGRASERHPPTVRRPIEDVIVGTS